ncbi:ATP-binding cassette domain-containing protein [Aestuariibacter halophilus]|uniref:ATP-binding cassette domain-containing protein n=1 Tax=Fluctibacter halophilus TaxID=226011 RepID=A0ABS8G6C2_9ALTE|nr:ATP-binding cassette domain-containing protein [Aestuariibacter halophilus]MCC2616073.1 ATP-binding cassette domain-containing protein [Aestuariibacter halophilus]
MNGLQLQEAAVASRLAPLSMTWQAGQMVHVIGPNGAGKSTLLHSMAGLLPLSHGRVLWNGTDVDGYALSELARQRALLLQQPPSVFALTAADALQFFSSHTLPEALLDATEIGPFLARPLNQLSGGEARRVHVCRVLLSIWPALMAGEGLVLLDEPTLGLDFRHQHLLFHLLQWLAGKGNLVVVSHHDLSLCEAYADKVLVLRDGQVLASGEPHDVMSAKTLSRAFDCDVIAHEGVCAHRLFQTSLEKP